MTRRRGNAPFGRASAHRGGAALACIALLTALLFVPIPSAPGPSSRTLARRAGMLVTRMLAEYEPVPFSVGRSRLWRIMRTPSGSWRPVVVLVPHMDDESLFLGETLAALDASGIDVTIVFTTSSEGGRKMDPRFGQDRREAYSMVAPVLGVDHTCYSPMPDGARLGGFSSKADSTEQYVLGTGAITPDCVLFTIGGGGHFDHSIAEEVGRRLARTYGVPLFVYLGYGPKFKSVPATDKDWGPRMQPARFAGGDRSPALVRKREAIRIYRHMYLTRGWTSYWVSIAQFELTHADQVGYVPAR